MEEEEFKKIELELDNLLTKVIHTLPKDLIEYIKEQVFNSKHFFYKKNSFQLELVIDTNVVYSEVRSLMVNGRSFLLKIIDNPLLKVYAPNKLKEEIYEKIKLKFPKDKKTRNIDITESYKKADLILSKIEILDEYSNNAYKKAYSLMNERDPDDISFVALNIQLNSHGILTKDKDIKDNKSIKTWDLKDVGGVITDINKGAFSFIIVNESSELVLKSLIEIIKVFWSGIINIVNGLIKLFKSIFLGTFELISDLPEELMLILGVAIIAILLIDELRKGVGNFINMLWKQIKKIISQIKEFIVEIWELFKELLISLKPVLNLSLVTLNYFMEQSDMAIERLVELEQLKIEEN